MRPNIRKPNSHENNFLPESGNFQKTNSNNLQICYIQLVFSDINTGHYRTDQYKCCLLTHICAYFRLNWATSHGDKRICIILLVQVAFKYLFNWHLTIVWRAYNFTTTGRPSSWHFTRNLHRNLFLSVLFNIVWDA
jgi:hypothetical protein